MTLFRKECGKTLRSLPYLLSVVVLLLFFITQFQPELTALQKPQPGETDYGSHTVEDPAVIMPAALQSLYREYSSGSYTAYPLGFYKNVRLGSHGQAEIAAVLAELTGLSLSELPEAPGTGGSDFSFTVGDEDAVQTDENGNTVYTIPDPEIDDDTSEAASTITLADNITWDRFLELMEKVDRVIGGGSQYGEMMLTAAFGRIPTTYEEALQSYRDILEKDHVTGAYARLFCDYMGLMAGILPVFPAVTMGLRDRRRIRELIFPRPVSSAGIVAARYGAMVTLLMLPFFLLAAYATAAIQRLYPGMDLDLLAFFRYTFLWITPTVMTATAAGYLLTELTDTPVAIAIQGLWWFFGLMGGMAQMDGGYGGIMLMPRHNTLGNTQLYLDKLGTLLGNRAFYAALALALGALTVLIYDWKRRGKLDAWSKLRLCRRHRKGKSAA